MREIPVKELISKSVERTKLILFRPFSLKKWLKFLVIAVLAGALSTGGGNGSGSWGNRNNDTRTDTMSAQEGRSPAQSAADEAAGKAEEQVTPGTADAGSNPAGSDAPRYIGSPLQKQQESGKQSTQVPWEKILLPGLALLLILGTPLAIFFAWLGARFQFIWLYAVVSNDPLIKEPFRYYKKEGNSLFRFFLLIYAINIAAILILGSRAYFGMKEARVFEPGFVLSASEVFRIFTVPLIIFAVIVIGMAVLFAFVNHFLVPIMAMNKTSFRSAWDTLVKIAREHAKDFFIFILALVGLRIVTAIMGVIIGGIVLLAALIAGLIVLGIPGYLLGSVLKAKMLAAVLGIIVGIPIIALLILLGLSIGLPFAVFFRNFSLYYLSSLKCGYTPLPLEEPGEAAPEEPGETGGVI
ncbi:MAG: hypothetical protein JW844_03685 [Candidatus Omnitrophica bacterium]|nr:hypothetical protein [Candidatus Omnitrophota bacterium]